MREQIYIIFERTEKGPDHRNDRHHNETGLKMFLEHPVQQRPTERGRASLDLTVFKTRSSSNMSRLCMCVSKCVCVCGRKGGGEEKKGKKRSEK